MRKLVTIQDILKTSTQGGMDSPSTDEGLSISSITKLWLCVQSQKRQKRLEKTRK